VGKLPDAERKGESKWTNFGKDLLRGDEGNEERGSTAKTRRREVGV
jgi:hypothetical protein